MVVVDRHLVLSFYHFLGLRCSLVPLVMGVALFLSPAVLWIWVRGHAERGRRALNALRPVTFAIPLLPSFLLLLFIFLFLFLMVFALTWCLSIVIF